MMEGRKMPYDDVVMEKMDISALGMETIERYRSFMKGKTPEAPVLKLLMPEFLIKLSVLKRGRKDKLVPTIAGLLMFGKESCIREEFPNYFLDYREELQGVKLGWNYRMTSDDGSFNGNIFEYYNNVIGRLVAHGDHEFAVNKMKNEVGKDLVVSALKEAVSNAVIHADYYGRQGIVIRKKENLLTISNPGRLLIPKEEILAGGISDPRNPTIFKLFNMIGVGDRAGSGMGRIYDAWKTQNWPKPVFEANADPYRVTLKLEVY